ncbi:MAG: hypothetical protein IPM29_32605 [Planctomycetes bacterium]|nr:hypothetical protein [Planctomycetota bacterium]
MFFASIMRALAAAACTAVLLAGVSTAQGSYTTYRQSCPSSVGLPELRADVPNAGFPWTLTVTNLRSNTAGYVIFAFRDDYLGVNLLPMDLAFLGAPSCYVNVNSDPATGAVVELLPSGAQGLAALTLGIPIDPTVMGFTFYNQYVSLDAPSGRSLLITTTNAGGGRSDRLAGRTWC